MNSLIVPPEELANVWPKVEDWIARAVDINQGDENLLDVLIAVARGQYGLWHEPGKWAAIVQVQKYPRQTVAAILYCGGNDLEAMARAFEYGKAWAKANGITVVRTYGRRGWKKVLGLNDAGAVLQARVA